MRAVTTFVVVAAPQTAVRLGRVEVGPKSADFYAIELERLLDPPRVPLPLGRGASAGCDADGGAADGDASNGGIMGGGGGRGGGGAEEGGDKTAVSSASSLGFPLPAACGPYLCTQGVGGHLTHFFPESYHAIDLRCGCRTPVLCIGDGVVQEVVERHHCGGIHAANLASWNAVSVRLDCGLVAEYLHTSAGSALVKAGDAVRRGQVLCETGDVGFAPEPHLHIELHDADDAEGPSVPLRFGEGRSAFVPVAGRWYSAEGEVPPAPNGASSASSSTASPAADGAASAPSAALPLAEAGLVPPPPRSDASRGDASSSGCCRLTPHSRRRAARFGCLALKRKLSRAGWRFSCDTDNVPAGRAVLVDEVDRI